MDEILRERLNAAVRQRFGDGAAASELEPLSGGASTRLWALTVDGQRLVLRVADDPQAQEREWIGQRAAFEHGVLAPEPLLRFEQGMLTRFAPGEGRPKRILAGSANGRLLGELAEQAARIHAIPTAAVDLPAPSFSPIEQALIGLEDELDRLGEPHPALELGLRWLWSNAPAERPACLVHGDLRLGNVLVGDDGLSAVLDWELAHLGNPVLDLGWLCIRSWRFGRDDRPAAGLGSRCELLDAYAAAGGTAVEPEELRFWEALGNVRWGVICVMQAERGRALGQFERTTIGRRACEAEWDLLAMIGEA